LLQGDQLQQQQQHAQQQQQQHPEPQQPPYAQMLQLRRAAGYLRVSHGQLNNTCNRDVAQQYDQQQQQVGTAGALAAAEQQQRRLSASCGAQGRPLLGRQAAVQLPQAGTSARWRHRAPPVVEGLTGLRAGRLISATLPPPQTDVPASDALQLQRPRRPQVVAAAAAAGCWRSEERPGQQQRHGSSLGQHEGGMPARPGPTLPFGRPASCPRVASSCGQHSWWWCCLTSVGVDGVCICGEITLVGGQAGNHILQREVWSARGLVELLAA